MFKVMFGSRKCADNEISSFQAFCTSLAARVGTGNMAGVSTAGSNTADTTSGFWSGLAGQAQDYNFGNFSSMFTKGGNAARQATRAMNPTVKSNLFNQGRIGNNQFGGNY